MQAIGSLLAGKASSRTVPRCNPHLTRKDPPKAEAVQAVEAETAHTQIAGSVAQLLPTVEYADRKAEVGQRLAHLGHLGVGKTQPPEVPRPLLAAGREVPEPSINPQAVQQA